MKISVVPSVLLLPALSCLPAFAQAADTTPGTMSDQSYFAACWHPERGTADVDAHISTLGLGLGLSFPLNHCLALRVDVNQINRGFSTLTAAANSAVNYTGNLKLNSYDFLVDWRPFMGIFHVTAGAMYNNNQFEMRSTGPFTLSGVQYTGTLTAAVTFKSWAPYVGVGWSGQPAKPGWSFKSDLGVMFQGPPRTRLTTDNPAATGGLTAEQAALSDKLGHYRYYPVIAIGVGYAF